MTAGLKDGVIKRGETWTYVVRVRDQESGISRPKWVGGYPTEAAAKAARDLARVAARRGEYVDRSAISVADYLHGWLITHSVAVKPTTLAGYRNSIENYVIPRIGGMRLQAVEPATASALYRDLLIRGGRNGGPLSSLTVEHVHRTLRKALNDAVHIDRLLPHNPLLRATRPRTTSGAARQLWSAGQLRIFLAVASAHRLGAFFRLAAYTGARRGELMHLRWRHFDFGTAEVNIIGSTSTVQGVRVEGTTKGGRSRVIGLDAGTIDVLHDHHQAQIVEKQLARNWWRTGDDLVFRTENGSPVHTDTPTHLMPMLAARAGLSPIRLHDLRHLHATTLLLAGVPVHVVAARLGHADPALTLRVYAHILREPASRVADIFVTAMSE